MKRNLAFIVLLIVLVCIGYLGFSIYENFQERQAIEKRIAMLPEVSLSNLNGEVVSLKDIGCSMPILITYFNTGCEFCQAEIRSIQNHGKLQSQAAIYLISDETSEVLRDFAEAFEIDTLSAIHILTDQESKVRQIFGVKGVPSTFVYGNSGDLLKNFQGETKAETLYELVK